MSINLNLTDKLDFSEIDLTEPNKVVEGILAQVPEETKGMVSGQIIEYDGPVQSYNAFSTAIAGAITSLASVSTSQFDVQDSLGRMGEIERKYECFICSAGYDEYKYRLFFMRYGNSSYPVQLTLEASIAQCIQTDSSSYIFICNNRDELEELLVKILTSRRALTIMQEFIRIYQANQLPGLR